jgi:type IV pilus assembly protein PilC
MLEPLIMVFVGGSVGFMLIAMYLPIFTIAGKVKGE